MKIGLIFGTLLLSTFSWAEPTDIQPVWVKKLRGVVSDLALSQDGKTILVATSPDGELAGSSKHYLLTRWNSQGKQIRELKLKSPTREVDLSSDGSLAVVSNYENQLIGFSSKSNILWTSEGTCRPSLLQLFKKIVCYHDDDAEAGIGFDTYDWKGKKTFSFPIETDIVAFKAAMSQKFFAFALAGGQLVVLDAENHSILRKVVEGEIVDVALSAQDQPQVAALVRYKSNLQVYTFDSQGNSLGVISPSFPATQVELSPQGGQVFYYGNSAAGQFVGSGVLPGKVESWKKGVSLETEYTSLIYVGAAWVLVGLEESSLNLGEPRKENLIAYDYQGSALWRFVLPIKSEAYLYTYRVSDAAQLIVAGVDNAQLVAFKVPAVKK